MKNSTKIFNRLLEVLNVDNLDKAAEKLHINPSTLRGRKARGAVPYKEIVQVLDENDLLYVLKGLESLDDQQSNEKDDPLEQEMRSSQVDELDEVEYVKPPSEVWPDDPIAPEFEKQVAEIVDILENGPFSMGLRMSITKKLLRSVEKEIAANRKQFHPNQGEKESENQSQKDVREKKP